MCKLHHEFLIILTLVMFDVELNSLSDEIIFNEGLLWKKEELTGKYQENSKIFANNWCVNSSMNLL